MSLQKVLYTIKGAAREQRSIADLCIDEPKLKALSLRNAEDMDAAAKFVEEMHGLISRITTNSQLPVESIQCLRDARAFLQRVELR